MILNLLKPLIFAALSTALLTACAGQPATMPQAADGAGEGSPGSGAASEPVDPEVMARVWAAEAAGAEGDQELAAKEYLAASFASSDPDIARRATEVAIVSNSWNLASMAADRWVLLDPENLDARKTAARTMLVSGDYVQAEYQLSGILERLTDQPWQGWDQVAQLLSHGQNAQRGKWVIDELTTRFDASENPYALIALSQVTARGGDVATARMLANQAIEFGSSEVPLHIWAGRLALTSNDQAAALRHYEQAWRLDPENEEHALAYAELLRKSGRGLEANDVLASLPDTPPNLVLRIAIAAQTGRMDLAESLYAQLGSMEVNDPYERAFSAARAAEMLRRPREAIAWYEQLSGSERALAADMRRANLTAGLGEVEAARQILREAVNGANANVRQEALLVEVQILSDAGQSETAMALLDEAIGEFSDPTRLLYSRALVAVELGQIDKAIGDLQQLLDEDPTNPTLLNALGYTLVDETDRFDEAEELINAAYELDPDQAAIIDSMGWVAYHQGRLAEAEMYLRKAFLLDRNAEIAAHLGEVLWAQDRRRDAIAVWAEGIKIDPENRVLNETLSRLGINL